MMAALLVASCGKGPPEFDDGKIVAWISTEAASTSTSQGEANQIEWSKKPSADQLRASYPADATGTVAFQFRCQVRRDTTQGRCALIGTDPDTGAMHSAGLLIAGAFQIDSAALKLKKKSAAPFADVLVSVCKRLSVRSDNASHADECIPEANDAPTDAPTEPASHT